MVSFDNTEIAFSAKSNKDLNRSYWLFTLVSKPWLVDIGKVITNWSFALHLPIKGMVKATIFKQFCGGETIDDCAIAIHELGKFNIGTILDYSVEGKESEVDFDQTTKETIATIERAKNDVNIPFSVFKVTGIARFLLLQKVSSNRDLLEEENLEYNRVLNRVDAIFEAASNCGVPVFIDAEESWIQNAIDAIANQMMKKYNSGKCVVYNTYQLYRKDRLDYLKSSLTMAKDGNCFLGAKLVRGAYMEKERKRALEIGYDSPIQPNKEATDRDYDLALEFCIQNAERVSICAGTHNEQSSLKLAALMNSAGISPESKSVYFSQLLGMSDHISYNLSKAGFRVAKYVPYGPVKEVVPYLIRRAQENTSVKGQTGRELSLLIKERKRRKA